VLPPEKKTEEVVPSGLDFYRIFIHAVTNAQRECRLAIMNMILSTEPRHRSEFMMTQTAVLAETPGVSCMSRNAR